MGKKKNDKDATIDDKERKKAVEAVAKHLRFNLSVKEANVKGKKLEYFPGSKAVDCLMSSKWAQKPVDLDSYTPYFSSRSSAVDFCTQLLRQRLFIRLRKIDMTHKSEVVPDPAEEGEGPRRRKVTDSPRAKKSEGSDSDGGKKKKKKFRLELHEQQTTFVDSPDEIYYWEYDPPSRTTYIIGAGIVVGAVTLTLQPLWPESTRAGVWYASMGLFGIMGFLVILIIARWFLFGLLQVFTIGKLHFWVLPNLDNEKCGFFESFRPTYSIEWKKDRSKKKKKRTEGDQVTQEHSEDSKNNGTEMELDNLEVVSKDS